MQLSDPTHLAQTFQDRFGSLLRATAESLDCHLEVRYDGLDPIAATDPPSCCIGCSRSRPEAFASCIGKLGDCGGPHACLPTPTHWHGPDGCEIAVLPLRIPNAPPVRLVAVRGPSASGNGHRRPEMLRFLTEFAHLLTEHFTVRSELAAVSGELSSRHEELNLLYTVSSKVAGQEDARQAIRTVLEQARRAAGAEAAFVHIDNGRIDEVAVGYIGQGEVSIPERTWRALTQGLATHLTRGNRRFFSGSQWEIDPTRQIFDRPAQVVAVMLQNQQETLGVLGFVHFDPVIRPRLSDLRLLESLAERIAMAIASSDLYENLKDFLMSTVKSLVSAIEAKDSYTSGHSERVNLLSMLLGKTMELPADELEVLRWASILHDVGKIGMPESILKKPGRLTSEEYEIVKEHPDRGYKVLAPIRQLSAASLGVRCHHEMVDGRGYPLGLHGTEIPRVARIIAVADAYDALTSSRPYRMRRSPDQAWTVIQSVRGTQLDYEVVDVLETLMPFIREHEVMLISGTYPDLEEEEVERKAA
jgi:hypothetical protein